MPVPDVILDAVESLYLSSPPQVVLRYLHLAKNDQCSTAELATLVSQDPSLCALVFSIANATSIPRGTGKTRIIHCLVSLGTRLIRTLASSLVVRDVFSPPVSNQRYDVAGFWEHSLRIAEMSRLVAAASNYPDLEEAYLSGLLHDTGQLLLLGGLGERYGNLLELSPDESVLRTMEEKRFGTDHAEIGAWLVDQWKFPSFMADAVLFHHRSADMISGADQLSRIVWSAHAISNHYAPETPMDDTLHSVGREAAHVISDHFKLLGLAQNVRTPDLSAVYSMLGIDPASAFDIHQQSSERVASIAAALGIVIAPGSKPFPGKVSLPLDSLRVRLNDGDPADTNLEDAVRDMAMLQSLQHDFAQYAGEAEILHAVRAAARVLFGAGQLAFLLVRPDKPVLSGANIDGQPAELQQLEILLDASLSLAAAACVGIRPRSTFETEIPESCSLVDIQVSRALGSEGVLYLPMHTGRRSLGVLAIGVHAARLARFQKSLDWIAGFAHAAAISLDTLRELQERERSREATLLKRFERQTRHTIHEAGNPLSIINNYLSIVRKKLPEQSGMQQELDILREEIDRVTDIVRHMGDVPEAAPAAAELDLNHLVQSMLVLYGDSLFASRNITVECSLEPGLTSVSGSRDSVKQILINLWNNARDAMPEGGCLMISTAGNVNQDGRPYSELRISDSGPGLPQDVLQNLFQVLPHNRRPGHSGVGLSIVAALVGQLGGRITCQSRTGQGTSFSILLPLLVGDEK